MNKKVKILLICSFLLVMGFLMANSLELGDIEDVCTNGQYVQVINGVWACSNGMTGGGNSSFNQTLTDDIYVPYTNATKEFITTYSIIKTGTGADTKQFKFTDNSFVLGINNQDSWKFTPDSSSPNILQLTSEEEDSWLISNASLLELYDIWAVGNFIGNGSELTGVCLSNGTYCQATGGGSVNGTPIAPSYVESPIINTSQILDDGGQMKIVFDTNNGEIDLYNSAGDNHLTFSGSDFYPVGVYVGLSTLGKSGSNFGKVFTNYLYGDGTDLKLTDNLIHFEPVAPSDFIINNSDLNKDMILATNGGNLSINTDKLSHKSFSSTNWEIVNTDQDKDIDIKINDGGTTRTAIQVHGDEGSLSFPRQSGVLAYLSSDQTIGASTATTIAFDAEVYDTLGEFNTGTSTFTAKDVGTYLFIIRAHWANVNSGVRYDIRGNTMGGTRFYHTQYMPANSARYQEIVVGTYQLTAGATFTAEAVQYTAGNEVLLGAGTTYTILYIVKVA